MRNAFRVNILDIKFYRLLIQTLVYSVTYSNLKAQNDRCFLKLLMGKTKNSKITIKQKYFKKSPNI